MMLDLRKTKIKKISSSSLIVNIFFTYIRTLVLFLRFGNTLDVMVNLKINLYIQHISSFRAPSSVVSYPIGQLWHPAAPNRGWYVSREHGLQASPAKLELPGLHAATEDNEYKRIF